MIRKLHNIQCGGRTFNLIKLGAQRCLIVDERDYQAGDLLNIVYKQGETVLSRDDLLAQVYDTSKDGVKDGLMLLTFVLVDITSA